MKPFPMPISRPWALCLALACGLCSMCREAPADELMALLEQLESDDQAVRLESAAALGRLGREAEPAVDRLLSLLHEPGSDELGRPNWSVYGEALGKIGEPSLPGLIKMLDALQQGPFFGACEGLHHMGGAAKPSVPILIEKIGTIRADRIWALVFALEGIGPNASEAVDTLVALLGHEDFQVQTISCRALAAIGPEARPAIPTLLDLLENGVTSVRGHSAMALGSIGITDEYDFVPALVARANDFHDTVRDRALIGLGRLGSDAAGAAEPIRELLADPSYRNAPQAAKTLWLITGEPGASVEALLDLTNDLDHKLRALQILGDMGPDAAAAVPQLTRLLGHRDPDVRFEAATALGMIGDSASDALPELQRLLSDEDADLAAAAQRAIDRINGD